MPYAGFFRRTIAYLLDMIPITIGVVAVFYFFLGFDETVSRYVARQPGDLQARLEFMKERNLIRGNRSRPLGEK